MWVAPVNYPEISHLCNRFGVVCKEYGASGKMVSGPITSQALKPVDFCPVCGLASRERVQRLIEDISHD